MGSSGGHRIDPVLVIVPTYNERDNLERHVDALVAAVPQAHVLVVDDNSPDGTGDIADELAKANEQIHVMHRAEKAGLGAAYIAGFGWGLERGYATLVEMDADGSHAPDDLPRMLARLHTSDLVIGSRYVQGGRVVNWPLRRQVLSRGANVYSRLCLGVQVADITAGYRAYRREVLEALELDGVASAGYCFQIELALRTIEAGFDVAEVPITFTERQLGVSKMDSSIVREAIVQVAKWGWQRRFGRAKRARVAR